MTPAALGRSASRCAERDSGAGTSWTAVTEPSAAQTRNSPPPRLRRMLAGSLLRLLEGVRDCTRALAARLENAPGAVADRDDRADVAVHDATFADETSRTSAAEAASNACSSESWIAKNRSICTSWSVRQTTRCVAGTTSLTVQMSVP